MHVHSSPRHVTVQSPSSRETFLGASIESPGDITGDGFPDLLIAASRYANGRESRAGAIYLLLGSAAGIQPNAIWSYSIPLANAQVGRRMTSAGDINGDGRRDLVTSSIPKERIGRKLGWLHVFYGMTNSYPIEADWRYLPKPKPASFVPSVALADINRDGFSDLIVGNPAASSTYSNEGCILVFLGGKNGLRDEPETLIYGNVEGAAFGATVTAAGDINGDGGPDLLVGALTHPVGGRPRCAVFLFTGNADGLTSSPQWSGTGFHDDVEFSEVIVPVGDLNHDGCADFVVGAPKRGSVNPVPGAAYLFFGAKDPSGIKLVQTFSGSDLGGRFGAAVAGVGDVNADGHPDLLIGAPYACLIPGGRGMEGYVYLYRGKDGGFESEPSWMVAGSRQYFTGREVAGVGDLNLDGVADFAIGTPERGRVDIFYGGATGFNPGDTFPADNASAKDLNAADRELKELNSSDPAMPPDSLLVPKRWRLILSAAFLLLALGLGVAFILFKRRHHAATDRERARIARDLHDDLGARLTRLSLLMDNATNDRLRPEDAAKQRSLVAVTAREILESMDGVIWAETPESDTLESLITFIIQYSTTFLAATPIRILLDTPSASPALKIGPQMKKNIFLVVKEALSNIVKHSGATEAKLAIQCVDSRLTITIVDNGRGLPAPANETNPSSRPASAARKGNGLTNMKIRMEEIGGSVSISPGPEHGAAVSLTVAL